MHNLHQPVLRGYQHSHRRKDRQSRSEDQEGRESEPPALPQDGRQVGQVGHTAAGQDIQEVSKVTFPAQGNLLQCRRRT